MQVNIADLFDDMEPMLEWEEDTAISSDNIKNLTQQKLRSNSKRHHKWSRVLLVAAVLCTLLCVTAAAGNWNPFSFFKLGDNLKESRQQTEKILADFMTDASLSENSAMEKYKDMGDEVYAYSFEKQLHRLFFYSNGEIKALDARDRSADYHPDMTTEEAAAYARKAEAACPRILDALHDDGYIKGSGSEVECCFCNDFAGSWTIFDSGAVWVDVLMKDNSAYAIFLEPDTFACEGFVYTTPENMPDMYGGIYVAMRNGTEAQWWYDTQHAGGLG